MRDTNLVNALRKHAEWAEENQWETPITLGDDLTEAADRIEAQAKEEEIDMDHEAAEQLRQLCQNCDLDRLEKLAEADRAGRLVVPPCKAGDTVYEVTSRKTISEYRVKAIRVELFCTFIEWDIVAGFVDKSIFGVPVDEIGKTVFLTREAAEKALEAIKDE